MSKWFIYVVLLILPVLTEYRQAEAEPHVQVRIGSDSLDICSKNRSLIIPIYVSQISKQDSILGYTIDLAYDSTKIILHDVLFINTLSATSERDLILSPGSVKGIVIKEQGYIFSNKPDEVLIAFSGEYIGTCPDTIQILTNTISFSYETPDNIEDADATVEQGGEIKVWKEDKPERHIKLITDQADTLRFDYPQNLEKDVEFSLQNGGEKNLTFLKIDLELTNQDQFKILQSSIKSIDENVRIDSIVFNEIIHVYCTIGKGAKLTGKILSFRIQALQNKNSTGRVILRPVQANICSCVTALLESSVELQSKEMPISNVGGSDVRENRVKVQVSRELWSIQGIDGENIEEITVSNILGQIVYTKRGQETMREIQSDGFATGIYILVLKGRSFYYRIKINHKY